jgi:hypothetical protein
VPPYGAEEVGRAGGILQTGSRQSSMAIQSHHSCVDGGAAQDRESEDSGLG